MLCVCVCVPKSSIDTEKEVYRQQRGVIGYDKADQARRGYYIRVRA